MHLSCPSNARHEATPIVAGIAGVASPHLPSESGCDPLHHGGIAHSHVSEKSQKELKEKGGQRRCLAHLPQEYSAMFEVAESAAKLVKTFRHAVSSPLAMFKHAQDVLAGYYTPELKGALASTNNQWPMAKFHETDRVKKAFPPRLHHSTQRPDI